jgi:O-methyltransferase
MGIAGKIYFEIGRKIRKICNSIFLNKGFVICAAMGKLDRERKKYIYTYGDYVRFSSLELVADEINKKKISGCVAELGVYKGDFARHINETFPDRKLYLYDTFSGFDERDIEIENNGKYSDTKEKDFSYENIEKILQKMEHRENCIIKKGYFPETTEGVDEKYAFVSIDVDLYEPTYNGLRYFYDRLERGGYIFIHDYNNNMFNGVKSAVKKYSDEMKIPYFPLSDGCGSVIIMK